jgi:hypothetical protein
LAAPSTNPLCQDHACALRARVVTLSVSGEAILTRVATVIAGMLAFLQVRKD